MCQWMQRNRSTFRGRCINATVFHLSENLGARHSQHIRQTMAKYRGQMATRWDNMRDKPLTDPCLATDVLCTQKNRPGRQRRRQRRSTEDMRVAKLSERMLDAIDLTVARANPTDSQLQMASYLEHQKTVLTSVLQTVPEPNATCMSEPTAVVQDASWTAAQQEALQRVQGNDSLVRDYNVTYKTLWDNFSDRKLPPPLAVASSSDDDDVVMDIAAGIAYRDGSTKQVVDKTENLNADQHTACTVVLDHATRMQEWTHAEAIHEQYFSSFNCIPT
jgi:hypothetical protein